VRFSTSLCTLLLLGLLLTGCAHRANSGGAVSNAPTTHPVRSSASNAPTGTATQAQPNAIPSANKPASASAPGLVTVGPVETSTTNAAAESAAASSPNAVDAANGPNASASRQQGIWSEQGIASWYGPRFQGKLTANGERFNTQTLTAAHKTLPFGTRVRVRSLSDAKEVIVRINDRGPFVKGRIIDLSQAAARVLGFVGVKQVVIERLP
jgi:rare lipoprotein A